MRNANEEEKKAFAEALSHMSVSATGTIWDLLENKKPKVYVVYCTSGDIESSYSKAKSAWMSKDDAELEVKRLTDKIRLEEKREKERRLFCSNCPLHDYNLDVKEAEKLATERCSDFWKVEDSPEDETFCENEYQFDYGDWYSYGIWEIELN